MQYFDGMSRALDRSNTSQLAGRKAAPYLDDMPRRDYDSDFSAWALDQAALLRAGRVDALDLQNLAEELESLSRSDKREIYSRMAALLAHLLKWRFQPELRCGSWRASIGEARRRIGRLVKESPSLVSYPGEVLAEAYDEARQTAADEAGLEMPADCPWTVDEALKADLEG